MHSARLSAQRAEGTISYLEKELDKRETEIQKLRAREQSLLDVVQNNHNFQEVSDEQVLSAFVKIRQDIQKLASSKLYQVDAKAFSFGEGTIAPKGDVACLWPVSPRGTRLLIFRSLLFGVLADDVFSYEGFGVSEDSGANRDENPDALKGLDAALSQLEQVLVGRKGQLILHSNSCR